MRDFLNISVLFLTRFFPCKLYKVLNKSKLFSQNLGRVWYDVENLKGDEMLRVVVYGRGRAGEVVAEFLEEELGVVEVVRVIDYAPAPTNQAEWEERAERNLARFWTRGVTVVLSDYGWASSEVVKRMRKRHPRHKFVRLEVSAGKVRRYCFENCVVAALSTREPCEAWGEELRGRLPKLTWALPDGKSWGRLIDQDLMTQEILTRDLRKDFVPSIYGINNDEGVNRGEIREVTVDFRIKYMTETKALIDSAEYRLYVMDGSREYDVLDYQPVEKGFLYNFFMVYTEDLIPNEYFIDIRVRMGREVKYYKKALRFKVLSNVSERYE